MPSDDTIAAIATAPGRAGIGVVRVSGPLVPQLAPTLLGKLPPPRQATLARFVDDAGGLIDQGLALYFPAPHSYTGEDVLELQGHGGDLVLRLMLERCLALGARLARPGEFTERAYLNDKLDLAQAEAVADLIEASTAAAARGAARSLSGEFSARVRELTAALTELRALVEAILDFPDEEIDFLEAADAEGRLAAIETRLEQVLTVAKQGSLLRSGVQVALIGRPNVGKSSLLNRLAARELAIVTPVPGTTRDAIGGDIEIEGVPLRITDTAGLRETDDPVERIGVERSWATAESASVVLHVIDATAGMLAEDTSIAARLPAGLAVLRVANKIDLSGGHPHVGEASGARTVYLSAKTGAGLDLLRRELLACAGWQPSEEGVYLARARHLTALRQAGQHLARAREQARRLELAAEELRLAQVALGSITGEFTADDLLGEIFSRFCLGK